MRTIGLFEKRKIIAYVKPRKRKMRSLQVDRSTGAARAVCFGCFRPSEYCFCELIPSIDNQTEILVLQHQRERMHPFNTARMVQRALHKSSLVVGENEKLAQTDLRLNPDAALLYPGPGTKQLNKLAVHERPSQLVILDGTWHHAKTLLRDIPVIRTLPRFGLAPDQPGQYRIRLEPTDTSLSTVEAVVAALKVLEPATTGLDHLLTAFTTMVDRQLAHPSAKYDGQVLAERTKFKPNIPYALIHDLDNVVVAYGESAGGEREQAAATGDCRRVPIYWVAQRLGTGETFQAIVEPSPLGLTEKQLDHLRLPASFFDKAISHKQFRRAWSEFVSSDDTLAVFNQSTLGLLENVDIPVGPYVVLNCVRLEKHRKNGGLDEVLCVNQLAEPKICFAGRAGTRLAGVAALARHLHDLGCQAAHDNSIQQVDRIEVQPG